MTSNTESKFYALLIGINYYESVVTKAPRFRNLGACVRDINQVAYYLKETLKVPAQNIIKLTAPVDQSPELAKIRAEEGDQDPTYENIVNAFKKITDKAEKGDQVYIHYSGHGDSAKTIFPELKKEQEDEGLVPMDYGSSNFRYLRDVEITTLFKRITEKGCLLTAVFDSCHSGGASRDAGGKCAIRGSREGGIDNKDYPTDSFVASREELISNWKSLYSEEQNSGWAASANEYTLLAACRPSESAYEYAVNGKESHGALTYWMMDTLATYRGKLTYRSLYNRVAAKIQSRFPVQLPMLIGKGDLEVFGDTRIYTPFTARVDKVNVNRNSVTLNVGLAQGMSKGTDFAIFPLNTTDFSQKEQRVAIVKLINVDASSSSARVLAADEGGIDVGDQELEKLQGAPAVLLSSPPNLKKTVLLNDRKLVGDKDNELPPELAKWQTAALERVRQALKGNGLLREVSTDEEGSDYQVAVGRSGEYEICIGEPIENLYPQLIINKPDSADKVVNRLVHLAKYQTVQEIDNQESKLNGLLEFELLDENRQPFADSTKICLSQGETVYVKVKNLSDQESFNIAILDLEPTWEISHIYVMFMTEDFFELLESQEKTIPLRFQLPDIEGYETSIERLKLFATRGQANFKLLTLDPLDERPRSRSISRGIHSPFGQLIEAMGTEESNDTSKLTRAAIRIPDPTQEWATKEIKITIN